MVSDIENQTFIKIYSSCLIEIQLSQTLECYSCSGRQDCGTLFSPKLNKTKTIDSTDDETLYSCAVGEVILDINVYHN